MELRSITSDHYLLQLQALLPEGAAWSRDKNSVLTKLLSAFAAELHRVHKNVEAYMEETDPNTTHALLDEWEEMLGLPDQCITDSQTISQRKAAIITRLAMVGGQSKAYFINLAKTLQFNISIDEFRPFRAGLSSAGDDLSNDGWIFTWRVVAPEINKIAFRAGESAASEPLYIWGNQALECLLSQYKPAQTNLQFAYINSMSG